MQFLNLSKKAVQISAATFFLSQSLMAQDVIEKWDFSSQKNLIGTEITEPKWPNAVKSELLLDLKIAKATLKIAPHREDSYIWLGRRYGYLGRNIKAIEVLTKGLEKFPNSYKLRRFRGRHLARTRQFEASVDDYKAALTLIKNVPDTFEPDGIPNPIHLPLGTYHTYIHYYHGQTNFALGHYELMLSEMKIALDTPLLSAHKEFKVARAFWDYMALGKLGRFKEAQAQLKEFPRHMKLIENDIYHRALMFLRGDLTENDYSARETALVKFALSMKYSFEGKEIKAAKLQKELIMESPLGFWPAEIELTNPDR